MVGNTGTLADVKGNKVRMYLKEIQKIKQARKELQILVDGAKARRATLKGGEWGEVTRLATQFDLKEDLV
jgi:hypothetical protein